MKTELVRGSEIKPCAIRDSHNEQNKFHLYADVPRGLSECQGKFTPCLRCSRQTIAGDEQWHGEEEPAWLASPRSFSLWWSCVLEPNSSVPWAAFFSPATIGWDTYFILLRLIFWPRNIYWTLANTGWDSIWADVSDKVYVAVRQTTIKLRLESKAMCLLHPQQPQPHP